jgi:Conjugative transposon protein TcpC
MVSVPSRASVLDSWWERVSVAHSGRVGGAVTRLRREPRERSVTRGTSAGLLKGLGRGVLWCVVALLLLRGAADLLATTEPPPPARGSQAPPAAWPDDEARAFAVDFARAYLGSDRSHVEAGPEPKHLEAFVAPELAATIAPEYEEPQEVQSATVARTTTLDARHALVTVAATVEDTTRYLAVPVGRDAGGALAVYDLPSFAPPPARAQLPAPRAEPLTGAERSQIEAVLERFFEAYLAGRTDELEYLSPAGTRLGALGQEHELVGLLSLSQAGPGTADAKDVLATVRARDVETKAVYALRYRLRLVRADRWYVAAINKED